jgi:alpha-tubulin suppressor-like RCC1 family protein
LRRQQLWPVGPRSDPPAWPRLDRRLNLEILPIGTQKGARGAASIARSTAFVPSQGIPEGTHITRIACGANHSAALAATGALFTWGWGKFGQLGRDAQSLPTNRLPTQFSDTPCAIPAGASDGIDPHARARVLRVACGENCTTVLIPVVQGQPPQQGWLERGARGVAGAARWVGAFF